MNNKETPNLRNWGLFLFIILGLFLIWSIRAVFKPLVIAALFAYLLNPLVNLLAKPRRISRGTAVILTYLIILAALIALPSLLMPTLVAEAQTLSSVLSHSADHIQDLFSKTVVISKWSFHIGDLIPNLEKITSEGAETLSKDIFQMVGSTGDQFIKLMIILAAAFYLLRDYKSLRDWLFNLFAETHQPTVLIVYDEIKLIWSGYLQGNLTLMAIVGVTFTLAWLAIGLPGAIILGFLSGLLTIIPDVGPAIAAVLAIIVAAIEGSNFLHLSNLWFAVLVLGIYFILINTINIFFRARIYARSVKMHDGVIFLAILSAMLVQGVMGVLIVVPTLASSVIIFKSIYRVLFGLPIQVEAKEIK